MKMKKNYFLKDMDIIYHNQNLKNYLIKQKKELLNYLKNYLIYLKISEMEIYLILIKFLIMLKNSV